jgi:hypothetical protein
MKQLCWCFLKKLRMHSFRLKKYFDGSEEDVWVGHIEEDIDRKMFEQEGEDWLAREASQLSIEVECDHQGRDDTL